jgi:epoxyqueuosine reductase
MVRSLINTFRNLMANSFVNATDGLEDKIVAMPGVHRWTSDSPVRFEIVKEIIKRGRGGPAGDMMRIMVPTMMGVRKSLKSVDEKPTQPGTEAPPEFIAGLEDHLLRLGASSVGYTQVPEHWIFHNKAILHTNAIVMSMEMDKVRIDTAPSPDCQKAVWEIYRDLGRIANKGAEYLRHHGYSAHAGHPLGGLALYPPLAQMAGLGWLGANGIIITPEHGPRVRLAAIFTSIENLPFGTQNDHRWVEKYCSACQICIRDCPAEAILPQPERRDNGRITHVINERCFPYFSDNYGCSVCIAVCPFSRTPYDTLKQHFAEPEG